MPPCLHPHRSFRDSIRHLLPQQCETANRERLQEPQARESYVQEYKYEFSRIASYLPFFVRSEWDKMRCFERGLRPSIYS